MNSQDLKLEEVLILVTVMALLIITAMAFEKLLPASFEQITGNTLTRVNVTQPQAANCNFTLYSGLNLVSFFCITSMENKDNVIENITGLQAIFEYQEGSSDPWKSYNPRLPSFVIQDFGSMSRTEGYWIKMSADENFSLVGGLRLPTYVVLSPGWNLAGYASNQIKPVNVSFSSIEGNFTDVRRYVQNSSTFISYVPGVGGALNQTEPNFGYWINATIDEVWVID